MLVAGKVIDTGTYKITEMLLNGEPRYLHFDNYKTGRNSAIVPISEIKKILT